MAVAPLLEVVVSDPAKQVDQIFQKGIPVDLEDRINALGILRQNQQNLESSVPLASYLTASINLSYQNIDVIGLSYTVAREVFKQLSPQVGKKIEYEAEPEKVSIFSDKPVADAVALDKEALLEYLLSKEKLSFKDIDDPLADYIALHTVEKSAKMLEALRQKNPEWFNKFIKEHIERLRNFLRVCDKGYEVTIDQFLELILLNKSYGLVVASRPDIEFHSQDDEAKKVMEIVHTKHLFIMQSLSCKMSSFCEKIYTAGCNTETLSQLKEKLKIFKYRLETAKDFLRLKTYLEEKIECNLSLKGRSWEIFERSVSGCRTDLNGVQAMLDDVNEKLQSMSLVTSQPRKRRR